MKPRSLLIGIAALCLTSPLSLTFAGERWCGCKADLCPQASFGWMLFVDSNRGTPDFWWTESVEVREIFICKHGIQYLFITNQRGVPSYTALVFPKPSRRMLAERLKLPPCSCKLEKEYEHFTWRYTSMLRALERISGGSLKTGARLSFETGPRHDKPVIIPKYKLELHWRGQKLKLRGYLDVYFAPLPRAEVSRHYRPPPRADGLRRRLPPGAEERRHGLPPPRPPKRARKGCCGRT